MEKKHFTIFQLIIGIIITLFTSCNMGNNPNPYKLSLSQVRNFSQYSSIGVATISQSSNSRNAKAASNTDIDIIVGRNQITGLIEAVRFNSNDGNEVEKELNVCAYQDSTPFLFVQFSKTPEKTQGYFSSNRGENFSSIFAISKTTGKIYDLDEIYFDNYVIYRLYHNSDSSVMGSYCYSNDTVFISNCNLDDDIKYIYTVSEEQEKLKIEKYCRADALGDIQRKGGVYITSDIYGNLMEEDGKYLTKSKELKEAEKGWYRSYDGLLYNENKYLDEDGNICTGDFAPNINYIFSDESFLYSNGLEYWYYCVSDANSLKKTGTGHFYSTDGIYKVVFTDETKKNFSGTLVKAISDKTIKIGYRFFSLTNNKVSYYDYINNTENYVLVPNCTITSIKEASGGIIYEGYGSDLITTVTGFINAETLEVIENATNEKSLFTPIYLTPLN